MLRHVRLACFFVSLVFAWLTIDFSIGIAQIKTEVVGWLENSYQTSETSQESGATSEYSEYLQNYQLGLKGFVLSSNFLSYYLGTRFEESQKDNGEVFWRTRTLHWYDFKGNFFRNRPVSFDLYLKRSQTDAYLPNALSRRFDDLVGGELHIRTWWLPRTRLGYRLITSNTSDQGVYRTHQTTIYVQKGTENAQVEGSFRDEQRTSPNVAGIDRNQELQIKGTADLWGESTTVSGEVNYTGRNSYKLLRSNLRVLGRYRERDRLFAIYSFNNSENPSNVTYANAFQGDYRRYISRPVNIALNTNLQRSMIRYLSQQLVTESKNVAGGFEYLDQGVDSLNTLRKSGSAFLRYQHSNAQGAGAGGDAQGFIEWRRQYSPAVQISHGYSLFLSYFYYADYEPYSITNRYLLNGVVRPIRPLTLQNRLTFTDTEGTNFKRSIEERGEATIFLSRRISFNSAIIVDMTLQPQFSEIVYWNNTLRWMLQRNLLWTTQSSWTYNRTFDTRHLWLESILDYHVRKLRFQIRAREEIKQGEETLTLFMSVARIIGSGGEIR